MKILLTGPDGQIGWELQAFLPPGSDVVPLNSSQLDLRDTAAIRRQVREIHPDLIINAAGYTNVDRAESEPHLAQALNTTAVGLIGEEACRIGAAVVHFSTDYVFDGRKGQPYTPQDATNPLSVYAQSKLDGEAALIDSGAAHLIIRTAWIYGLRRRNFLLTMLEQAARKPELQVVHNQIGCPTWCRVVAQATARIIFSAITSASGSGLVARSWSFGGREGTYHLCCGGWASWFQFAQRIFQLSDIQPPPKLVPITSAQYAAPAKRPNYSVLDCSKTRETFGVPIAEWGVALEELLTEHRSGQTGLKPVVPGRLA